MGSPGAAPDPAVEQAIWQALLARRDTRPAPEDSAESAAAHAALAELGPMGALFAPLLAPPQAADGCVVLGRIAQTLDGRIATPAFSSQWIGGAGDIQHTHRLRALCHAVVVGGATVQHDDPRLTTREVSGPNPVRVVLDTERRLGPAFGVFQDGGSTLLACAEDRAHLPAPGHAELLPVPRAPVDGQGPGTGQGGLHLPALLQALAARGLTRIFVEGGGVTISRFLAAGCFDRLHVTIAPILLGCGVPAFTLPPVARIAEGLRFSWRVFPIGEDLLADIALGRAVPAGCAGPTGTAAAAVITKDRLP